jgi:hypothetical protein
MSLSRSVERGADGFPRDAGKAIRRVVYESVDGILDRAVHYYDDKGRECDGHGKVAPSRPATVPSSASWFSDEDGSSTVELPAGWADGARHRIDHSDEGQSFYKLQNRVGVWRIWTPTGTLHATQRYTMKGHCIQTGTGPAADLIGDAITAFLVDPQMHADRIRSMARDPETRELFARAFGANAAALAVYVLQLERGVDLVYLGAAPTVAQPAEIIRLVSAWETSSPDAPSSTLYTIGARAAIRLRDRKHLARWWNHVVPDEAKKLRRAAEALLDKRPLMSAKEASALDDVALQKLADRMLCSKECELWVRDPDTGEGWIYDRGADRMWHWRGGDLVESKVRVDFVLWRDHLYTATAKRCDERVLAWPHRKQWFSLQRYGANVLWNEGRNGKMKAYAWLQAPSAKEAARIVRLASESFERAELFGLGKKLVLRIYGGLNSTYWGVDGKDVVREENETSLEYPRRVIVREQHSSHEAAVAAFDRNEIAQLRNGKSIAFHIRART